MAYLRRLLRDDVLSDSGRLPGVRVLCIGNGGIVVRGNSLWTYRCTGEFLEGLSSIVREICFCAWLDPIDDPLAQTSISAIPRTVGIALPRWHGRAFQKLFNGLRAFLSLARQIWISDFVYLYWPGRICSVAARLTHLLGKPYGIYFRGEQVEPATRFGATFRRASFVIATGEGLCNEAKRYCSDVENVTPMTSLRPEHIRDPRAPTSGKPWQLLYVGRIEERKGVFDLLEALALVISGGHNCNMTLIGHCYDVSALKDALIGSLASNVTVIPPVTDFDKLMAYYAKADAFVLASHDEGFPRVLYEAMASGLSIVTTFVGSIPHIMKDSDNCLRITPRSPSDIAEKIRLLLDNRDLALRIATGAHKTIKQLLPSWNRSHSAQVAEKLCKLKL